MKCSTILGTVLLLLAPLNALHAGDMSQPSTTPNIVIILADDFGVGDIRAHYPENKIPTPHGHSHYTGWQQLVAAGHQPSGPYRGHKGDIWEGGHRVPLVVRWPGHVKAGTTSDQMVCLTDVFATCAEIVGTEPPANGAEDSLSFLPALMGKSQAAGRTTLVSHSNFGEFAYRDGPWKLVWRLSERNLEQSRGKPTVPELYNLDSDVGEQTDLSQKQPDILKRMTEDLRTLIDRGTSRHGQKAANDTTVRFETTQEKRWAQALREPLTRRTEQR